MGRDSRTVTRLTSRSLFAVLYAALFHSAVSAQEGFISIDCGKPDGYTYTDSDTGLVYVSDSQFIATGENHNVSSSVKPDYEQAHDLRSFPGEDNRNCYTLKHITEGNKYMLRAFFMYGNYDEKFINPQFDLYLGTHLWYNVQISDLNVNYYTEIIAVATADVMLVCLVKTGSSTPFISALELRPLNHSIYNEANTSQSLILLSSFDYGPSSKKKIRYPSDNYDRLWNPHLPYSCESLIANTTVNTDNSYRPPSDIMKTAMTPAKSPNLELDLSSKFSWVQQTIDKAKCYVFMHFAELSLLGADESRVFTISLNNKILSSLFSPKYMSTTTIIDPEPTTCDHILLSIRKQDGSTLPPIINGLEIYVIKQLTENSTAIEDVNAIENIKSFYKIKRNWIGDPCARMGFIWDGLSCDYNVPQSANIISLNLSHSQLTGGIPRSLSDLTRLQSLDLSMNNLAGDIPDFIANLTHLKILNLRCSGLSGSVPKSLWDRSQARLLTLSLNQDCSYGDKQRRKIAIIVVASVGSALSLTLIFLLRRRCRGSTSRNKQNNEMEMPRNFENLPIHSNCKQFKYTDIVEITNNFNRILGKGGFGFVYHGVSEMGLQVAIKMLSETSSQGPREFQNEAQLLSGIHHKNLVPLVGYCKDGAHLALVYEYMEGGNLENYLRGTASNKTRFLTWRERLRIAIDVAQGLEYLHKGCKPAIVHRDVKPSNVLLNARLEARISDLGLSKIFENDETHVTTMVMGTPGYLDPDYYVTSNLNERSDVYSFGVVLLELISGLPPIVSIPEKMHIVHRVHSILEHGEVDDIIDKTLKGEYVIAAAEKLLDVALACSHPNSTKRPTMSDVVLRLKECLELDTDPGSGINFSMISSSSLETVPFYKSVTAEPSAR